MTRKRGQIMIEFFLYIGVFMFIVMSTYVVVSFIQSSEVSNRESLITREIGESFKNNIRLAVRAGDGFSYNIIFSKNLLSKPYSLEFNEANSTLTFTWEGTYGNISYAYNLPVYDYEFTPNGCITTKTTSTGLVLNELKSDRCSNNLNIVNDGKKVILTQQP